MDLDADLDADADADPDADLDLDPDPDLDPDAENPGTGTGPTWWVNPSGVAARLADSATPPPRRVDLFNDSVRKSLA